MARRNKKDDNYEADSEKKDSKIETNSMNNNMLLTTQKWKFGKAKFP